MIGIDTNVVLRYLLKDDPVLSPRALEIIAANDCFVTRAALTEVVYTLESYYRSSRGDIGRALDALLSLQRVSIEDRAVTERALSWYKGGMDFGDAMIAASSHGSVRVETFDLASRDTPATTTAPRYPGLPEAEPRPTMHAG